MVICLYRVVEGSERLKYDLFDVSGCFWKKVIFDHVEVEDSTFLRKSLKELIFQPSILPVNSKIIAKGVVMRESPKPLDVFWTVRHTQKEKLVRFAGPKFWTSPIKIDCFGRFLHQNPSSSVPPGSIPLKKCLGTVQCRYFDGILSDLSILDYWRSSKNP